MRNRASSAFKRVTTIARYICPDAWWLVPFSVLVVGLTARVVESRLDLLGGDNYWLMVGVDKPFQEFAKISGFHLPLELHYWVSYRVFGSSISGYLVLPLISSLAALLVVYFGIKKQWGHAAWGVCFLTLGFLVFNGYSLFLANYAMITYGTELLVSCGLFFLFIRLSSGMLTRRQWTWVALISIPAAFFSNIYILPLVFAGAVSVIAVRYWHSHGRYRLNDLRQHVMEMLPLAVFPVVQVAAMLIHPLGAFAPIHIAQLIFPHAWDAYFFGSSNYPETFWGAVQFVSHNTVVLLRGLLQTAPYKGSYSLTPSIFVVVAMLIIMLALAIRMLQRRLKPDMSFVITFTILALFAMAVGGLLGIYPYGPQRYAGCLLLPMGLIIAYAATFVITKIIGRLSAVLRVKAIPFVLALIIIVAGTVCNVNQLHYNTGITVSNWAALHQIREAKADLVLIGGYAIPAVNPVYPDFFASAHNMGWLSNVGKDYSDTVPPEIVYVIEGTQSDYGAVYTPRLVIDYVATGRTPTSTLTLYPVADTNVAAQAPTGNYGTETQVVVQAYTSSDRQRGLFQFDLSSIPAGSTINSATFSAYYYSYYIAVNPVGRTYCLYRNTSPWTETEVNWNNQPSFATTGGTSTVMPESFGWVNWNVKDIVQTWVDGATNYGLVMMDSNETEGVNSVAIFYSKGYPGTTPPPRVVIDYTPASLTPTPTPAHSLTLNCMAATNVAAQAPTSNYGTETQVVVQAYTSSDRQRGLFQFDLSSIPAGSTINSATFSAYYYSYYIAVNPVGRTYCLYRNTSPWTETEVNWNNQPSFTTMGGTSTVMPESFGWVNWNVKDIVQTWVDGATNYGLVMMDSNETEGVNSLTMFYTNVNADTILVIDISKGAFNGFYAHWSALLDTYFDLTSEIQGPSIWGGYYTRKE